MSSHGFTTVECGGSCSLPLIGSHREAAAPSNVEKATIHSSAFSGLYDAAEIAAFVVTRTYAEEREEGWGGWKNGE